MIQEHSSSGDPRYILMENSMVVSSRIEEQSQNLQHGQQLNMELQVQQQLINQQQLHFEPQQHQQMSQQHVLYHINNNNAAQLINYSSYNIPNNTPIVNPSSNQDAAMSDLANTSDASVETVEDSNPDVNILPPDEAFAYLQGLNSDNLMQFSQESALQELMMKEQLDIKPNLHILPTFEEHDIGGYKFRLNVCTKGKASWIYSDKLNKVYLRMNDIFMLDAVYTPKMPMQQLRIRALLCFVKEVSEPVVRCQNHLSKDAETHPKLRQSLLRCENPSTEYCGTAEGKSVHDRLSVLIPLGVCTMPKDDNSVKHTIAMKFTCQNSCIGRKETSIIFLLESMHGEILSQRVLDVKICSCPKRDRNMDERNIDTPSKRKMNEDLYPNDTKMRKQESPTAGRVKEERSNSDLEDNSNEVTTEKKFDLQRTASGSYRVVMEFANKELVQFSLQSSMNAVAGAIISDPQQKPRHLKNFRRLKRLQEKLARH